MRYALVLGFCVFAAACAGEGSRGPTSPSSSVAPTATDATAASALPFKGTLEGTELIQGAAHHIDATGNATHLGLYTLVSDFTVNGTTASGSGTAVWTAANGDRIFTDVTGTAVVAFPIVTVSETDTVTGGTGRFAGATGTFAVERTLNLLTHVTSGSFVGTISLDR
jgi:hypothetical protein